jgi:hypothetical protein
MSDKPLPVTVQGVYEGYAVSVTVDVTLDKLPALVRRMKAHGIEPMPTPAAGGNGSQGSKQPVDTLEGAYQGHWFREPGQKGPVCKVSLTLDDGSTRTADFWQQEPRDLFALGQGARVRMFGRAKTSTDALSGKQYQNFSVSRWEQA